MATPAEGIALFLGRLTKSHCSLSVNMDLTTFFYQNQQIRIKIRYFRLYVRFNSLTIFLHFPFEELYMKSLLNITSAMLIGFIFNGVLLTELAHAQDVERRFLYANSKCKYPIRFLVYHKDSGNPQHAHAWYNFRPYEEKGLEANDVVLRQIVAIPLYIYAETLNEPKVPKIIWAGNDAVAFF
ncbi:MAG: hypothetical protein ACYTXC_09605 [Nostoc sp.]